MSSSDLTPEQKVQTSSLLLNTPVIWVTMTNNSFHFTPSPRLLILLVNIISTYLIIKTRNLELCICFLPLVAISCQVLLGWSDFKMPLNWKKSLWIVLKALLVSVSFGHIISEYFLKIQIGFTGTSVAECLGSMHEILTLILSKYILLYYRCNVCSLQTCLTCVWEILCAFADLN